MRFHPVGADPGPVIRSHVHDLGDIHAQIFDKLLEPLPEVRAIFDRQPPGVVGVAVAPTPTPARLAAATVVDATVIGGPACVPAPLLPYRHPERRFHSARVQRLWASNPKQEWRAREVA